MGDNVNEAGEPVELFGTLELVLSEDNSTGYKDVFYLKDRKKKPYSRPRSGARTRRTTSTWAPFAVSTTTRQPSQWRSFAEMVVRISPAQTNAVLKKVRAPPPAPRLTSTNTFATHLLLRSGAQRSKS